MLGKRRSIDYDLLVINGILLRRNLLFVLVDCWFWKIGFIGFVFIWFWVVINLGLFSELESLLSFSCGMVSVVVGFEINNVFVLERGVEEEMGSWVNVGYVFDEFDALVLVWNGLVGFSFVFGLKGLLFEVDVIVVNGLGFEDVLFKLVLLLIFNFNKFSFCFIRFVELLNVI